jgi:hypothetical protein
MFDCSKVDERWIDGWKDGSCGWRVVLYLDRISFPSYFHRLIKRRNKSSSLEGLVSGGQTMFSNIHANRRWLAHLWARQGTPGRQHHIPHSISPSGHWAMVTERAVQKITMTASLEGYDEAIPISSDDPVIK